MKSPQKAVHGTEAVPHPAGPCQALQLAYHLPARLFVHDRLRTKLSALGRVVRLEKTDDCDIWYASIRLSDQDLAALLFQARAATRCSRSRRWRTPAEARELFISRLTSKRLRGLISDLGPKVKRDKLIAFRNGPYLRVSFIWRAGSPGALARPDRGTPPGAAPTLSSAKN